MSFSRYRDNPFLLRDTIIKTGDSTVVASKSPEGSATITTHITVIENDFVAIASQHISKALNLNSAGRKALTLLIWQKQTSNASDAINLDNVSLEDFLQSEHGIPMTIQTFRKGLIELERHKIIAKTMRKGIYHMNEGVIPMNECLEIKLSLTKQRPT